MPGAPTRSSLKFFFCKMYLKLALTPSGLRPAYGEHRRRDPEGYHGGRHKELGEEGRLYQHASAHRPDECSTELKILRHLQGVEDIVGYDDRTGLPARRTERSG